MNDPVATARAFMGAWERRNWRRMHETLQVRRRTRTDPSRLQAQFGFKLVSAWAVAVAKYVSVGMELEVEGEDGETTNAGGITPEMVVVGVDIRYRTGPHLYHRGILLGLVLEDRNGQPPSMPGLGTWGVNDVSALREFPLKG